MCSSNFRVFDVLLPELVSDGWKLKSYKLLVYDFTVVLCIISKKTFKLMLYHFMHVINEINDI